MAAASGLDFYNDPGPVNSKQGVLIGIRNGFFICAGPLAGQSGRIGVIARFKGCADSKALLNGLKQNPAMKKMYMVWNAQVTSPQTVLWSFGKPLRFKKEEFAAAIEAFVQTVAQFATPFDVSKCESCNATVQQLVLANGNPTSMCAACQSRAEQEKETERKQYEASDSTLPKAFIYGLGAAVLSGALWAVLAWWDYDTAKNTYHPKLHMVFAALIALAVAYAIKVGVGRINIAACIMASVLTAVGKIVGDVLFFGQLMAHEQNLQLSQEVFRLTALNLWQLKWGFSPLTAVVDVLIVAAAAGICWGLRPKFALTFKTYPMPRSAARATAAAAKA
jgi:hypothetical protein